MPVNYRVTPSRKKFLDAFRLVKNILASLTTSLVDTFLISVSEPIDSCTPANSRWIAISIAITSCKYTTSEFPTAKFLRNRFVMKVTVKSCPNNCKTL